MNNLTEFLEKIGDEAQREKLTTLFQWILAEFPDLTTALKWNQPMFLDHGTFIIAFSVAKQHFSIAPETVTIHRFADEIEKAGYTYTDNIIKIKWNAEIDYHLLKEMIAFNIIDKAETETFWR